MSRKRTWPVLVRLVVALLVAGGLLWASRFWHRRKPEPNLPSSVVRFGEFSVLVRCRGELAARKSVQLTAPLDVPDLQIVWLAPPGSLVKVGDIVVRFDPSKPKQDLKEKQAALDKAQATLDQEVAQSRITADQDKVDLAKATYDREKARLEASKKAIVSAMEGEKSTIDLGLAAEKVKVQEATNLLHAKSGEAKVASLEKLRDAAKAEVDLLVERLKLLELKSPLQGMVNYASNRSQGWFNAQPYKVGDHAVGGTVIAEIPDLSSLAMEGKIDEVDRGRIAINDAVLVHIDAFPEKVMDAKVVSISPLPEQSFNEWPPTRSFRAFALLDHPTAAMRPGMNAGADFIQTKLKNVISVPAKAVFTLNGQPTVYVKDEHGYSPVKVGVRARNPDEIAVDGLKRGAVIALAEPAEIKR
jgi:HlyD family secretion protein